MADLTPDRRRRAEELYRLACDREPKLRVAFLDEACASDDNLRRAVESLLIEGGPTHGVSPSHPMAAAPFSEDLSGRLFGQYRIVAPLGEGGMARVYRAYQSTMDRFVALKVLSRRHTADPRFLQRFRHEARIVAQFQHPHILSVFDFGETDGFTFLAMPLIDGGSLAQMLKGQPLALAQTERIMRQLCEAIDYSHSKSIVHRDIKPSNVLIDEGGNCLLADFGLAQILDDTTRLTLAGTLLGTPAYMSPEQVAGQEVGTQSDLYSLGIVLYELLTGRVPFKAETPIAVALKHLSAPLPPPSRLNSAITPGLEAVVLKALARSPEERFASGEKLAASLSAAIRQFDHKAWSRSLSSSAAVSEAAHPVSAHQDGVGDIPADLVASAKHSDGRARHGLTIAGLRMEWLVAVFSLILLLAVVWFVRRGAEDPATTAPAPATAREAGFPSADPTLASSMTIASGTLLIDALPWAEVVEILNVNGQSQALAAQTYTPLAVSVPGGVYQITLKNPLFSRIQSVTVVVPAGGTQRAFTEFEKIDADAYFQNVGWPLAR